MVQISVFASVLPLWLSSPLPAAVVYYNCGSTAQLRKAVTAQNSFTIKNVAATFLLASTRYGQVVLAVTGWYWAIAKGFPTLLSFVTPDSVRLNAVGGQELPGFTGTMLRGHMSRPSVAVLKVS